MVLVLPGLRATCKCTVELTQCDLLVLVACVTPMAHVQKEPTGLAETAARESRYEERRRKEKTEIAFSSRPAMLVRICFVILKCNKITLNYNYIFVFAFLVQGN